MSEETNAPLENAPLDAPLDAPLEAPLENSPLENAPEEAPEVNSEDAYKVKALNSDKLVYETNAEYMKHMGL